MTLLRKGDDDVVAVFVAPDDHGVILGVPGPPHIRATARPVSGPCLTLRRLGQLAKLNAQRRFGSADLGPVASGGSPPLLYGSTKLVHGSVT